MRLRIWTLPFNFLLTIYNLKCNIIVLHYAVLHDQTLCIFVLGCIMCLSPMKEMKKYYQTIMWTHRLVFTFEGHTCQLVPFAGHWFLHFAAQTK